MYLYIHNIFRIFSHIYNIWISKHICTDNNTYAKLFASPGLVAGVLTATGFTVGAEAAVGVLQELEQVQSSLPKLQSPQDLWLNWSSHWALWRGWSDHRAEPPGTVHLPLEEFVSFPYHNTWNSYRTCSRSDCRAHYEGWSDSGSCPEHGATAEHVAKTCIYCLWICRWVPVDLLNMYELGFEICNDSACLCARQEEWFPFVPCSE